MYIKENCTVRLFSRGDNCEKTFTIVRSGDVPSYNGYFCGMRDSGGGDGERFINIRTPLGKALLDHDEGDIVSYVNFDGEKEEYEIIEIVGGSCNKVNKYGILTYDELRESDRQKIRTEIENRHIWRLCHLTRTENLASILGSSEGILSQDVIKKRHKGGIEFNDNDRFDGHSAYVSCSIQRSNSFFYRAKKDKGICRTWAMISIDPYICCDGRTEFCRVNASKSRGWYLERGYKGFVKMFMDTLDVYPYRTREDIRWPSFTTDEQAEVMIFHSIPVNRITGISFPNATVRDEALHQLKCAGIEPKVKIRIESDMF